MYVQFLKRKENKMKKLLLGIVCASMIGLSGCAMVPSHLGYAVIKANKEPVLVTEVVPKRVGRACGFNILGLLSAGDISTEAAKRDAGIRRVATVDKEIFSLLGVFSSVCTIVTGE